MLLLYFVGQRHKLAHQLSVCNGMIKKQHSVLTGIASTQADNCCCMLFAVMLINLACAV